MIISASRRTDIPAFYSDWFMNRIREGYVLVRNPFNPEQVSQIALHPDIVDCIVFCTKNPANLLDKLSELDRKNFRYYFQFTLTPYGKDLEVNLPDKQELVSTFIRLSKMTGRDRVVWRYDPIVLTDQLDVDYHTAQFQALAEQLTPYAGHCVMSFLDFYAKSVRNLQGVSVKPFQLAVMREIAFNFSEVCRKQGLRLETCSEEIDLSDMGIPHGKCIDDERITRILGKKICIPKAQGQRKQCGCASSIDIGAYNSCPHNCLYCYANYSSSLVQTNCALHDPASPFLIGRPKENDKISIKKMESFIQTQAEFLL